jgi:hypothetical protein
MLAPKASPREGRNSRTFRAKSMPREVILLA